MKTTSTTIEGETPAGRKFVIETKWDSDTSQEVSRRFEWLPHGEVGIIGVPMHRLCWFGQLYFELTRYGFICDETAKNCFATHEGGQNIANMPKGYA
jgi:hypothetical protein